MTPKQLKAIENSVAQAIQLHVNGKIELIRSELLAHAEKDEANMAILQQHMEDVKPFMQSAAGLQILWKFLIAIGSLAVAWMAIKNAFWIQKP